jgi:hypothetical protein
LAFGIAYNCLSSIFYYCENRISCVMISVFVSSAKGCGFEPRPGQIKDYKIGICFFSVKDAELIRQSKDWLVRNQDNVSE